MNKTLGVIVGRFQTDEITPGHDFLFDEVHKRHQNIVVFIGNKPPNFQPDEKNPLDFFSRRMMLIGKDPKLTVLSVTDKREDEDWSIELDKRIDEIKGNFEPILYGSRDSFISHYKGKYKTIELESNIIYSATSVREKIIQTTGETQDFRKGFICGVASKVVCGLHHSFGLVVEKNENQNLRILLGKKRGDKDYSLFGALYNPITDMAYHETVKRGIREQLGNNIQMGTTEFLFDKQLDHWAYSSSNEKIHANFFVCRIAWGFPRPNSEFELVEWVNLKDFENKKLVFEFELFKDSFVKALKDRFKK